MPVRAPHSPSRRGAPASAVWPSTSATTGRSRSRDDFRAKSGRRPRGRDRTKGRRRDPRVAGRVDPGGSHRRPPRRRARRIRNPVRVLGSVRRACGRRGGAEGCGRSTGVPAPSPSSGRGAVPRLQLRAGRTDGARRPARAALGASHRGRSRFGCGPAGAVVPPRGHRRVAEDRPSRGSARTRAAVDRAVAERLPAGEPVSTFLSGGLDSSLVTAAASARACARGEPPPISWSLHFGTRYPNELDYAAAVAAHVGTDHRVVEVTGKAVAKQLRRMVWHLDEPIGDPVTAGNFVARPPPRRATRRGSSTAKAAIHCSAGRRTSPCSSRTGTPAGANRAFREAQYLATWRRAGEEIEALLHPDLLAESTSSATSTVSCDHISTRRVPSSSSTSSWWRTCD